MTHTGTTISTAFYLEDPTFQSRSQHFRYIHSDHSGLHHVLNDAPSTNNRVQVKEISNNDIKYEVH
jgi:hypothetical protein